MAQVRVEGLCFGCSCCDLKSLKIDYTISDKIGTEGRNLHMIVSQLPKED